MGRLKRLELENFKSYYGLQIVGPFDDFTCIIGPNGSGKSNMMDAISFVLGVQSRHLRSNQLKELIFRKDSNSPPERKASVKLVYETSESEISGYKKGQLINFSRVVSSTGVSSYKLDDKEVTYEVYESLLQKIGVLVKARNFLVFQGDVESVASKSPQDLTKLLEHICGSDLLRVEYEELLQQKAEAEEKTIFSLQKKKMISTQKKEVKDQKDEAEDFQLKREQLNQLKTEYILWKIFGLKITIEEHQKLNEKHTQSLETAKANELKAENDLSDSKKELARYSKALAATEKDLSMHKKKLTLVTPRLMETKDKLKRLRNRVEELQKSECNLQKDLHDQNSNIKGLKNDMTALEAAEKSLKSEQENMEKNNLQLDEKEIEEYSRLREELAARTATDRMEEISIEQEVSSKRLRIQRIESQEEGIKSDIEAAEKLITEYSTRVQKLDLAISESAKEKSEILSNREKINEEIKLCQQKATNLSTEMDEVLAKLSEVGEDRRRGKQEEKMAEALETMKKIFTGVHGKLIDLCRPIQKKYSQAVSTTAGKHMDAIVVDTKQTASDCIRYMKDQRIGTCTILPLDNISSKPIPDRLRALGNNYRLCIDLVECEDIFKPAINYALGSTIICDSLEEAQELCFSRNEKLKVVTLSGHVISKSGSMTGGSTGREGNDRWEEKDIEKLRKKKVSLEESVAENKRSMPSRQHLVDLETKLKTLQTKIQFSEADKRVTEEKLTQLQQQCSLKSSSIQELKREAGSINKEVNSLDKKLAAIKKIIQSAELDIFGDFSKTVGVSNIREYEESKLKIHQELMQKFNAIGEQKASLSAQLEYEEKRDFKGSLNQVSTQINEGKAEIAVLEEEEKSFFNKEEELRTTIKSAEGKLKSATDDFEKENKKAKLLHSKRIAAVSERDVISKKVSGEDILIERARAQIHEVLLKAEVDEIYLPTLSSSEDDQEDLDIQFTGSQFNDGSQEFMNSDENSRGKSRNSTRNSTGGTGESAHFSQSDNPVVLRNKQKIEKVDLSSLKKHRSLSKQHFIDAESALNKKINALTADLEAIQPNMHASEKYEGVVDKLKECTIDLEKAKDTAKTLSVRFDEVKSQRQKQFHECFQHVSESLSVIYKDLTKSSRHPLGGNAYLTLDNSEEPYLGGIRYTAMPPMKRFRDMDQLSGGEKTMAALALLFSIHSYRQAPFFVLDEVDAALDNVNVKKICNYIRQRSKDFQCIVISLKDMFFEHADSLVGVCRDVDTLSSCILTLDLKQYDDVPDSESVDEDEKSIASGHSPTGLPKSAERKRILENSVTDSSSQRQYLGPRTKRKSASVIPSIIEQQEEEENEYDAP